MKIKVSTNRDIDYLEDENIQGENNATVIYFEFPEKVAGLDINELNKYIIFNLEGVSPQLIENNQYTITDALTQKETLEAQIYIKRGKDLLFKSEIFELNFGNSLEVNYTITIDDLDIIDSLITQYEELNKQYTADIATGTKSIKDIENEISEAEKLRTMAEDERKKAETTRSSRFEELEKSLLNAISLIKDLTDTYNQNAKDKTDAFDSNYTQKLKDFNDNVKNNTISFNDNVKKQIEAFDNNVENKSKEFNDNYTEKLEDINSSKNTALSSITTAKTDSVDEINKIKDNAIVEFNNNAADYERKNRNYRVIVTKEISKMTEYTLPCNYTVGNDSLVIFYNSERLLCEKSEDQEAHYREIGDTGTISNKVIFGWDIPIGRVFDFIVKGEHASE